MGQCMDNFKKIIMFICICILMVAIVPICYDFGIFGIISAIVGACIFLGIEQLAKDSYN